MAKHTQHTPDPQEAQDDELFERTEAALQAWPEGLQASALDGYLCGVLLQPKPVQEAQWLPWVLDAQAGAAAAAKANPAALAALLELARQRRAQLNQAIQARQWFDPWLVAPDSDEDGSEAARESVLPWAAGFALAMQAFPALMDLGDEALLEPLALVFLHFDPEDLEDADDLREQMQELEPPESLAEAAEDLVRAVLLMADVTRPVGSGPRGDAKRGVSGNRPSNGGATRAPGGSKPGPHKRR